MQKLRYVGPTGEPVAIRIGAINLIAMEGGQPLGTWSSRLAPNAHHQHLHVGRRYRVIKEWIDHDREVHPVGEEWTFLGHSFLPYHDGMSFFVSPDDMHECHIRLQWIKEEQGEILDNLRDYLAPLDPENDAGIPFAKKV